MEPCGLACTLRELGYGLARVAIVGVIAANRFFRRDVEDWLVGSMGQGLATQLLSALFSGVCLFVVLLLVGGGYVCKHKRAAAGPVYFD
jgi:hypothetical protein